MPPPTGVDDGKPLEGVECIELQNECLRGDYAKVKELVDGGADVNETDSVGRTALMIAAPPSVCPRVASVLKEDGRRPCAWRRAGAVWVGRALSRTKVQVFVCMHSSVTVPYILYSCTVPGIFRGICHMPATMAAL